MMTMVMTIMKIIAVLVYRLAILTARNQENQKTMKKKKRSKRTLTFKRPKLRYSYDVALVSDSNLIAHFGMYRCLFPSLVAAISSTLKCLPKQMNTWNTLHEREKAKDLGAVSYKCSNKIETNTSILFFLVSSIFEPFLSHFNIQRINLKKKKISSKSVRVHFYCSRRFNMYIRRHYLFII